MKKVFAALTIAVSLSSCVVNVEEQTIDKEVHTNAAQFNSLSFDGGALSSKLVINGSTMDTLSAYATASVWGNNDEDARRIAEEMELTWSGSPSAICPTRCAAFASSAAISARSADRRDDRLTSRVALKIVSAITRTVSTTMASETRRSL